MVATASSNTTPEPDFRVIPLKGHRVFGKQLLYDTMILYDTPFSVYDTILYDTILYDIHNPNSEASNKATISRLTDRSGFLYDGCKLAEDRSGFAKNRNSLRHTNPSN